jgi:uncharacterized protein YkwD
VRRCALSIALAVAVIAFGSGAPAAGATRFERSAQSASAQSDLLITLINAYRSSNGLQQVSSNGALTAAAAWMAGEMASRNYVGHISSDGRSPTQRMSAFGYPATSMHTGENLGAGYETAGAVLAGWQASAAHNAVLLNPNYDAVGIGLVYNPSSTYRWYWAADFGGAGGTVHIVVPPPTPEERPVAGRAAPAPRGSDIQPADEAVQPAEEEIDPEALAQDARAAILDTKRITHLFAALDRIGEI